MDFLFWFVPLAAVVIGGVLVFRRVRNNFSDLAAATDSKSSGLFWTIVAIIYTLVVGGLWIAYRR